LDSRFSHADDDGSGDLNRVELVAAYREIFGSQSGLSPRVGNIPINAQKAFEDFATCDTLLATRQRFNVRSPHHDMQSRGQLTNRSTN
jgi:hypothetical protein